MHRPITLLKTLGVVLFASSPTYADTWLVNAPGDLDLELMQLFQVETEGPRARREGMTGDPGFISEVGTAFAVSEKALITAKHVPHEAREFRNESQSSVVWIPDRTVEIRFAEERQADPDEDNTQRVTITPSPFPTIDAARINLLEEDAVPFALSMCPIQRGGTYYLVKLRGGDLGFPVVVPITADTNEHSGAGDLRLFTHNLTSLSEDLPKSGDSGSPILDASGRVVGLLTAILDGTDRLYVTLTRDWVDLVPPEVRVACDTSVTIRDLNALEAAMTAYIDEQYAPLRAETDRLTALSGDLVLADEVFKKQIADLDFAVEAVGDQTTATVGALMDKFDGSDFQDAKFKELFDLLRDAEPVVPAVSRANQGVDSVTDLLAAALSELSVETWSFDYGTFQEDSDSHLIDVSYEREVSAPVFSNRLRFCYKAMLPLPPDADPLQALPITNIKDAGFYRFGELDPVNNMDRCVTKAHQPLSAEKVTEGVYGFSMSLNDAAYSAVPNWNGMVYAFVYDPDVTIEVDGQTRPEILHRMVFVSDPTDPTAALDCYYYGLKRASARVTLDLATIATTPINQINGVETCSG